MIHCSDSVLVVLLQVDHTDNSTFTGNDICPVGYYCEEGSNYPTPCPIGTFSRSTGITNVSLCLDCLPGHYCNVMANVKNTTMPICDPGYSHPSETFDFL